MRTKDQDKLQRIKEATVRLILREGIDGASVSKIAKEANVSPATIYIYYDSKEEMLSKVFKEYSRQSYQYLVQHIHPQMEAGELIEVIVRESYTYFVENEEIFSFVEQCSRCPTLCEKVCERECTNELMTLIHEYQRDGRIRACSDWNLWAMIFAPVRFLAMKNKGMDCSCNANLDELVQMIQSVFIHHS